MTGGRVTGGQTTGGAASPGDAANPPADPALRALLPNLFIIGASKSGTSALHAYLRVHPELCMSREKEPCFFVDQEELREAWPIMARRRISHDWRAYLDLFRGGEALPYRGEGSVFYSQYPRRTGVPERLARLSPDARLIYLVREPVSRAIAHYWQRYKEFQEPLAIEDAVRVNPIYRDTSDYALQLNEYLKYFDMAQIRVIVSEELRTDRRRVLAELLEWLGVSPYEYRDSELLDRHGSPSTSRRQRFPFVRMLRNSSLWEYCRTHLSDYWLDNLRRAATSTFDKSEVDDAAARKLLQEHLAPRRREFEAMIGRQIPMWDAIASEQAGSSSGEPAAPEEPGETRASGEVPPGRDWLAA